MANAEGTAGRGDERFGEPADTEAIPPPEVRQSCRRSDDSENRAKKTAPTHERRRATMVARTPRFSFSSAM